MIIDSPDLYRGHFMLSRYPTKVRPNTILNLGFYPIDTIFGTKDYVVINL
jgi:hypothetical protein